MRAISDVVTVGPIEAGLIQGFTNNTLMQRTSFISLDVGVLIELLLANQSY